MDNSKQIFYVQYDDDNGNYLNAMRNQDGYNRLSDDDKKKYTSVIVPLKYLGNWGLYWDKVRYYDNALQFGDFPKDQSQTIADLKNQLNDIISSNKDAQASNKELQNKLSQANVQIQQLGALSTGLQAQIAKVNGQVQNPKVQGGNK